MIRRMSHATIFVNNQDEALEFYRDKLGFEVHTDAMVGPDFRWLTMNTRDQPDFEIVLMEPKPGMLMDEETSTQLRAIMAKGVLGAGVFNTDDCRGTYEELKGKGVVVCFRTRRKTLRHRSSLQRQLRKLVQPHATQRNAQLGTGEKGNGERVTGGAKQIFHLPFFISHLPFKTT